MVYAIAALGLIGLGFGLLLSMAARVFAVKTDPRVEKVKEALPGSNCGACGYPGCATFAEAVVSGEAAPNGCIAGGKDTAEVIAEELGMEIGDSESVIATVFCIGDNKKAADRFRYEGVKDCAVADSFHGGFKACSYGCLGLGNCVRACPFEAIEMGSHGLPVVDPEACTGCGLCVEACPRDLIKTLPRSSGQGHLVLCSSHERGKTVSKACSVGCIGCRACVKECPQEAIEMDDKLAVIDIDKCDDCGRCVPVCPPGTIYPRTALPLTPGAIEKSEDTTEAVSSK
ncbi:MAG: RnfABCDGE type electron transport complex subunit B [Bacillota bacterium]